MKILFWNNTELVFILTEFTIHISFELVAAKQGADKSLALEFHIVANVNENRN